MGHSVTRLSLILSRAFIYGIVAKITFRVDAHQQMTLSAASVCHSSEIKRHANIEPEVSKGQQT